MAEVSDELLVYKTTNGDIDAFGQLVSRYQHQIYDLTYRMLQHPEDAKDATQEIFIKAHGSLASFQYQSKFSTWLYKVASNHCLDYIRKRNSESKHRITQEFDPQTHIQCPKGGDDSGDPVDALIQKEEFQKIQAALLALPETYRLPLVLQHYRHMSYQEIALAMDISAKNVATRIHRAKMMLKNTLAGGNGYEL